MTAGSHSQYTSLQTFSEQSSSKTWVISHIFEGGHIGRRQWWKQTHSAWTSPGLCPERNPAFLSQGAPVANGAIPW